MKRIAVVVILALTLVGCGKQQSVVQPMAPTLSVEQVNDFRTKIIKVLGKKSWNIDGDVSYINTTLPAKVEDTYYADILAKSKDSGYDFSKLLGKQVVEGVTNIKFSGGDVAGTAHFFLDKDKIVGAYYNVGNYIYSLNEKEVFRKTIEWKNIEDAKKKAALKEMQFSGTQNLFYWNSVGGEGYLYAWEDNKLKLLGFDDGQFTVIKEITLDGLYVVSMFLKDIDKDKKPEMALLVSTKEKWWSTDAKSKLLVYEYGENLKPKYSLSFEQPMWSVDFDGEDIIATSEKSIEMYQFDDGELKKNYAYNKVGGVIKVDDIDGSGVQRYILRDSLGQDVYVFQKNKGVLEEIWRSFNQKAEFDGGIQTADLNGDGVKEIYLSDRQGSTKRIILGKQGFIDKNDDIKPGHSYFVGDFDLNGKYEYFDMYKAKGKKVIFYKY